MIKFFPTFSFHISRKMVEQLLGYRKRGVMVPENVGKLVDREILIGQELLRFKGVYLKLKILTVSSKVELENRYVISSERFSEWVKGCNFTYFFVVTAGPLFSERVYELIKCEQVTMALVADAVGSAAAETYAEYANRYIVSLEKGNILTKRYSPGYGDWEVADNRNLLQILEAEKIGITVNEGGIMLPEKSVSAAIGVKTIVSLENGIKDNFSENY